MNPSNSLLLLSLPISNVITSLCSRLHSISHLSCQNRAGNSILLLFNTLFTKIGGEFKTVKAYSACAEQASSMCFGFDSLCFYPCAHNSSRTAEKILSPCSASSSRESEFWAVQQWFLSWLHIGTLIQDGGVVKNHSLPWLALIRTIFPGELGRCLQGLQDTHYMNSFQMLLYL